MSYANRIPLCVLQGKLDALERAIDTEVADCDSEVQLIWRTLRSPLAEAALRGVSYGLRVEFDDLTRIVTKKQLVEYQRLQSEGKVA